jgi:SAM-dependent MidA family methyltransferase
VNLRDLDATDNPALREIIAARIRDAGPVTFAEFMELALYHARHGYYITQDPSRDYQSSPHVHPVFGACVARQLVAFWRAMDRPARFTAFEAGAGDGTLAADVLRALRSESPDLYDAIRYVMQDVTLARDDAWRRLEGAGLPADKVEIAPELPHSAQIDGTILSNELLDALPFHRVRRHHGALYEVRVGVEVGRFVDVEAAPSPSIERHFAELGVSPADGCDAEVNLAAPAWVTRAAASLRHGYLLTLDYGYEAPHLYAPWRKQGTLLTFFRHTSGDDPYARVGRQDITASVDFTSVMRAGEAAGLSTLRFDTQADFLASLGIGEALAAGPSGGQIEAYYALRRAVIELTDSTGLGRIQALVQYRDGKIA